jgi:coenzyme F420-reducing hydrogenase beta subunit
MKERLSPNDMVRSGLCIGCGSCVAQAQSSRVTMQFDSHGELKPNGPKEWLRQPSETFSRTCPFSPAAANENEIAAERFSANENKSALIGSYRSAYVGHVAEEDFRLKGSSGGMVTWVATELLRKGLIDGVAHVVATKDPQKEGRYFQYQISRTENDVREGAKSRYYPIELSQVLKIIREVPGRYAVVGIPCFIKAVHLLRKQDPVLRERIPFTLGLFCGHMKSARFVESFAWQMKVPAKEIQQVEFRYKYPDRPANWYNAALTLKDGRVINKDWWHLADGDWGAGFFMNHACNFCDDVTAETADVAFGDAWVEPYSSDGRGTNVVVVRSPEIEDLITTAIAEGRLQVKEVDAAFVEQTQAAGFRQRREGLAYRLTWATQHVQPLKRVTPNKDSPAKDRKKIYRMRYYISKWSHKMFWLARTTGLPQLYLQWARMAAAAYHGLAYHKGKVGEMVKRLAAFRQ